MPALQVVERDIPPIPARARSRRGTPAQCGRQSREEATQNGIAPIGDAMEAKGVAARIASRLAADEAVSLAESARNQARLARDAADSSAFCEAEGQNRHLVEIAEKSSLASQALALAASRSARRSRAAASRASGSDHVDAVRRHGLEAELFRSETKMLADAAKSAAEAAAKASAMAQTRESDQ